MEPVGGGAEEGAPAPQRAKDAGCAADSWEPVDRWGGEGGRVYATAINALTLETATRYRGVPGR